ncbi:MAG: polysaccharide deacetylase family protein [Candidatus Omnitrophica bacterium]|nr:polysaccharide deacetylase family protein [Candidatus Omnitrophota bacterium]
MIKKVIGFICLTVLLIVSIFALWVSTKYTVPIMMYHNVDYTEKQEANWVSPERFETHMAFLEDHHYDVISFSDFIEAKKSGKKLSRKTVVITFDDGYDNNYTYALPVLRKHNLPAILFMPSARIDKEGHLTLAQLQEMMNSGIEIGSHGRNHEYLPDKPLSFQKDEIFLSKKELGAALNTNIMYFAYPIGGFSDEIIRMVREAGYDAAATTNRGYDRFNDDLYELNRIRFSDKDNSDMILRAKLSGYYNLFRGLKNPN